MTSNEQSGLDALTRPIIGINNRTAQEVFDIMCDRIRLAGTPSPSSQTRVTYSQAECDELCEIAERDGYEKAVQEIDRLTGGDGEYRVSMLIGGGVDDERHTPDAPSMIRRIVDRFETLNLLRDAEKSGRDQDWGMSPEPQETSSKAEAFDRIVAARKRYRAAVSAYNARRDLANAERMRGSWAIKLDEEYRAMSDAQSDFHRVVQDACDAALSPATPEKQP